MDGMAAADAFVEKYFPNCSAAMLCGSVARGEAGSHSDLDLLVVTSDEEPIWRRTYREHGWLVEAFIGSLHHYQEKLQPRPGLRNPSFIAAVAEAVIIKDAAGCARSLIDRATLLLARGPEPLTADELDHFRYVITDWLDDLQDSASPREALFIAPDLIAKAAWLLLSLRGRWTGERRWLYRELEGLDDEQGRQLIAAAERFYRTGKKDELAAAIDAVLAPVGGRLYEGFSREG